MMTAIRDGIISACQKADTMWLDGFYQGRTLDRDFAREWCREMNRERP